ncbi:MAG: alpha-amylase family glycosyl hydrolase [bacterium]|nr:alpha-amylase family glycosyl hydrolase [bacterium]
MANTTFDQNRTDFRDETIYFAMTTRFYDGDPKNNVTSWDKQEQQINTKDPAWRGDFAGLIEKLDYIKALGFTAIWITPIVQNGSGIDYHGYHAMDFSSVDLRYESRKEWGCEKDVKFQDLIDAAHAKGMKIVLDVVLQHTGNFGEAKLNPLFTRDQNIKNQANIEACMIPCDKLGGASYWKQDGDAQYNQRWQYFKNPQGEPNNYYHHYGTGWNWDLPNRWWAQIAGDCVDLNTENNAVAEYIVECYGKFIEMGVDAFRIDTSGHIAPLTFNKQFIPQFHAIANKPEVRAKRLNGIDFYMFGEVCQRFQGTVVYRNQANLSSYFYTWKSDESLLSQYNGDPAWWRQQSLNEGHDTPVGPMILCEQDTKDKPRSENVWMKNGQWHEPDYSQASGLNVIDFPVHYSFKNVGEIQQYFKEDNYYNDASFNVVYVDSHDYSPGPNDGIRFNGGTSQWAENLSWMFTFRGIPCIYYGSEVEFMAGKTIDDGMNTVLGQTGRAYFGHYLEGNVTASDFGEYTASGQVQKTLNGDLAFHIQQLNKIRAAVPALRKGQYTYDGCSANGGWAFKRAYKDSYALVAVNGGATFTGVPAGTYTDIVTGQTYNGGGTITVNAPATQGQLRVLVKNWTGGKVVSDGKFIYTSSPVSKGGNPTATDPGASFFYTKDDAVGSPSVSFSPAGGSFRTETQTVTATLNEVAKSGWYQVGNGSKVNLTSGQSSSFTIGSDMSYGQSVTVSWGATGEDGKSYSGTVTYKKVDPNASITIYVKAPKQPDIYVWSKVGGVTKEYNGAWANSQAKEKTTINGTEFWYVNCDDAESVNVVFHMGDVKTNDITGITEDTYFEYDGATTAKKIDVDGPTPGPSKPVVTANPAGGKTFTDNITVSLSVSPAVDIHYTTDGSTPSASSAKYTSPLTFTETTTLKTFVTNEAGDNVQTFIYTKTDTPVTNGHTVYFDNSTANWSTVYCYAWNTGASDENAAWPGILMTKVEGNVYSWTADQAMVNVIFNNGGDKTDDLKWVDSHIYKKDGSHELYNGQAPDPVPPTPGGDFVIYYDNSVTNWSTPHIHHWSNPQTNWPGVALTNHSGHIWKYTFTSDPSNLSGFLFCAGEANGGDAKQTADYTSAPQNGHLYKGNPNKGTVEDMGMYNVGAIESVDGDNAPSLMIAVNADGNLVIRTSVARSMMLYGIDGTSRQLNVPAGETVVDGLQGIYIIEGKKVRLH